MSETERLYRNEKTIAYAKKKNGQYYIENNDDEDQDSESKDQDSESENQNSESENEIFDQKDLNQAENQLIVHQQDNAVIKQATKDCNQILTHAKDEIIQNLESMVDLPIEASKIDQPSTITEIESDSEIEEISTSNQKEKEVEKDNPKVLQLLTPEPVENLQSSQIGPSAAPKTPAAHDAHAQALIQEIQSATPTQEIQSATTTQEIQSAIDEANIIPQGVDRTKRVRKEAHAVALKQAKSEPIKENSTNTSQDIRKEAECASPKNHKDDISLESTNYKHSHSSGPKQVIQIEINQLQSEILISEKDTIISNELIKTLSPHRHKNIKHLELKRDPHPHEDGDASFEEE